AVGKGTCRLALRWQATGKLCHGRYHNGLFVDPDWAALGGRGAGRVSIYGESGNRSGLGGGAGGQSPAAGSRSPDGLAHWGGVDGVSSCADEDRPAADPRRTATTCR